MIKKILGLQGVRVLSKDEQRNIKGAIKCCDGCDPANENCYAQSTCGFCGRVCSVAPPFCTII